MQILITLSSIILLGLIGYTSYHLFTRPKPEILTFFNEVLPEGKISLHKSVVEQLLPFRSYCNRNHIPFNPIVLQLILKNTSDAPLMDSILYVSIDILPRKELVHLKPDNDQIRIKKTIGKFQKNHTATVPLIVTGFFSHIDVEFYLKGRRADSRVFNRVNISDSKSFELQENPPFETKSEHQDDSGKKS